MNRLRFALGQQGQRGAPPQIARFHSLNLIFALGQRDILRPLVPGAIPLAGPRKAKQIQPLPRCPSCPLCIWHLLGDVMPPPSNRGARTTFAPIPTFFPLASTKTLKDSISNWFSVLLALFHLLLRFSFEFST